MSKNRNKKRGYRPVQTNTKVVPAVVNGEDRFVIIDADTDEVWEDANGYRYKTARNAHAALGYGEEIMRENNNLCANAIKSELLCFSCKYNYLEYCKGASCKGCKQFDSEGKSLNATKCRCGSVKIGERCPYYESR